jgi:signal transduction histidine kinase
MPPANASNPEVLLARFDEFIESASRLETSHRELQDEVVRLRRELEDRNLALEKSLREVESTRQVLLRLLEALPCGVVLLDTAGEKPLIANPEAQRLLWPAGGNRTYVPLPLQYVVQRSMSGTTDASIEEEVYNDATNPPHWLAVRATRVMFSSHAPEAHHLLIIQNISTQKTVEEERERARNSLALAEMSSVLAHEIRNPLGAMELFISLLQTQGNLNGECLEWTNQLSAGVRTMTALVGNVLQTYTSGRLNTSRMQLSSFLYDCAQFLEPMAQASSLTLRCDGIDAEVQIKGDEQALRQVIVNLCMNSIRHSPEASLIAISAARHENGAVRICISDQGCGISAEHLPHIFEAGFSANGRSSGLGLAVCQRIVEAHGGTIGVLNSSSQGTTMCVELPAL